VDRIKLVEGEQLKKDIPRFKVGDLVRVHVKIQEEDKTRTQVFEGIVIGRKGSGIRETFRVRRISYGEGVERVFPLHSPVVEKVEIAREGKVRRAKLYYLREKVGKRYRVKEKIDTAAKIQETDGESAPSV